MNEKGVSYRGAKVKVEAEETSEGDSDNIVAADVDVGNECLPPTAHGHTCS